jgi:serine phosphatase RsbU (regulator of sigma subunit)
VFTCLVFYALPLILLAFGFGNRWRVQESEAREQAFGELDAALLSIRRHEDPEKFMGNLFQRLLKLVARRKYSRAAWAKGLDAIRRRFPGIIHLSVVDEKGDVIPELTDGNPAKTVLKRLFTALREKEGEERKKALERFWSIFRAFLGPAAAVDELADSPGNFFEVSMEEKKRRFGYFLTGNGGMFVHLDQPVDWEILSVRDQCRRFGESPPTAGIVVGLADFSRSNAAEPLIRGAMDEFHQTTRGHIVADGAMFSIMGVSTTARLWGRRELGTVLTRDSARFGLTAAGTLIFAAFALFSFTVMIGGRSFTMPIRMRLIVLFIFASGLPLAVIILAGWDYLHQKYQARIREVHDRCEVALRSFDSRFPRTREGLEKKLADMMGHLDYETPAGIARVHRIFSGTRSFLQRSEAMIFNPMGDVVWKNDQKAGERRSREGRKLMAELCLRVLARLNNEAPPERQTSTSAFFSTFNMRDADPITQVTRQLGRIIDFSMAGNQNWTFVYPFRNAVGRSTHLLLAMWGKTELERFYVGRSLISEQRNLPGSRLFAFDAGSDWMFPANRLFRERLKRFVTVLGLRQTTTTAEIDGGHSGFLITGINPKELSGTFLVAVVSNQEILREIRYLRYWLWVFSIGSIIISVFLGVILSRRFLEPIGELSRGVQAIQQRNFQHRLPPGGQDELGDLAVAFNRVMEGMGDLEVGRVVQESLLPQEPLRAGEYQLFGATTSASELGGDYFDYHSLPDGRFLLLIGDVSGHGVPSALVMAMARALVERECELEPSPENLLKTIHGIFFKTLKRKRMMSCFLAILDPQRHELHFANAGHNYPYLFHPDGSSETLISQSVPLGSKKNITLEPKTIGMNPGDALLLYTDGLIEAKMPGGEEIGYDRMEASVKPLLDGDPRQAILNISEWHRRVTAEGAQEDDITLVLLVRCCELAQPFRPESGRAAGKEG